MIPSLKEIVTTNFNLEPWPGHSWKMVTVFMILKQYKPFDAFQQDWTIFINKQQQNQQKSLNLLL